jgi:serine/threonine-protein kinase RIM15
MPSPSLSPLLTSTELAAHGLPQHHHLHTHQHRRQSSATSDILKPPISPHLTSVSQPQPRPAPPSIKDFEIIKPISKGAFGSVFLSKKKATGEYFAIKVLKKADMVAKNQVTNVKAERAIMMWQGESDFVAKLYWTFSSKEYLYLVMEYLNGGDCASLVKVLGGLPEDWAKRYIAEVVLGVEHLHNRGIVHRDLKPDNLLIDQKGHLKLTDFGLSRMGLVGRQKRVLKSPNEPVPDLLKQGPFPRAMSLASSRSASFDFQGSHSPSSTPIITPDTAGSYNQPSYFSLNHTTLRENSRRASGYRSDSGGSDTLNAMFRTFSLSDGAETPAPFTHVPQGAVTEDEAPSEGGDSPHLVPLSRTVSHTSTSAPLSTPPQQSMLPPPMALFDPEDHSRRFVGTPDYLAPETVNGVGQDEMSDWWSLGCILFEFLYGYPPFNAATPDEVFENILNRRINWPEDADELVSPEAKDLMNKLMTINPEERLGANIHEKFPNGSAEIRAHPWFLDINWDTLLEDKAQFVPNIENPEDTEYFDARGATLQSFHEEMEDQLSPQYPVTAGEYPERPHDALSKVRSQVNSIKRGLMPLHIPPHVRDSRSRRLSEPVMADDFGNFNFKNLPMLERANKDVIQRLRQEAMQAQQRQLPPAASPTPPASSAPSLEGSPLLPMPLQRAMSQNRGSNRPASPSGLSQTSQTNSSPNRPSQPSSPLLVQFSTGQNLERRKTSGSSSNPSHHSSGSIASEKLGDPPRLSTSVKLGSSAPSPNKSARASALSPEKTVPGPRSTSTRARSQTIGSQDSEGQVVPAKDPFLPGHHKRKSQLFDISPSSSDNEDPRTKALLKVQRRRQSSRRLSQINLLDGPFFRPLDVLICEDHPVSRLVMERLFEKLRCRTITAVNGSEAIRYGLSEVQFDIIMTEVKLPQINGADVARMVRETRSANRTTPIIAVTGYLKDLPESHHFDALIEKPPTLTKLTETLCKFCQWKPPPKDYIPTQPLAISPTMLRSGPAHSEDSPSSTSSGFPLMPPSSYRGSSREDSIGSSYFGDMDSIKPEEVPVIISRHTEEWGATPGGLGISEDAAALMVDPKSDPNSLSAPQIHHAISAPPTSAIPGIITPRKQRSTEAIRAKRESLEKRRYECAESGDDEDEELGNLQGRTRSPHTAKGPRSSSKLGTEMMRTNSRGSVVSGSEDILKREIEAMEQRKADSAEACDAHHHELGERLGELRIPEESETSSGQEPDILRPPTSSQGSPDRLRRPALSTLQEYPTEIHSPTVPRQRITSSQTQIFNPSQKDSSTPETKATPAEESPGGDDSLLPAEDDVIDPDTTPRPAPTPATSELDDVTPRAMDKTIGSPRGDSNSGGHPHQHLRDILHWRRR